VCSDVPYSPFEIEDSDAPSGYSGFDIELMQAIADNMGLDLAVKDEAFDAIQSGAALGAGECDVAASAMTITPEREENVNFADPYFDADQSLMVKADSGYASLADLSGQAIGVQADTTGQEYAEENAPDDVTVTEFPDAAALFAALEAGQIQGILQDLPVNADRASQDESLSIVETYPTGEQYGFATAGNSKPALLNAINEGLQAVRDDGTYDELYAKYFPTAE
jgi:polar amino acid transport system substrate-binding protein